MVQEGRRKTISEDLDEMNQVFENMRRHIEQHHEMMAQEGDEMYLVFENMRQYNERWQDWSPV